MEFGIDIQISHLTVQNHVNKVAIAEVFLFTSDNHVSVMTSDICTECTSSSRVDVS